MTKAGIHAFARSLSAQLIDKGIRVNAIAPGPVWTPLNPADRPAEDVAKFGSQSAMRRAAQPEELLRHSYSWPLRPAQATSPAKYSRWLADMARNREHR